MPAMGREGQVASVTDMDEQNNLYLQRINLVIDTIVDDPAGDLSLSTLADVAGFSPFHFHRIFKSIVGETLSQFVWRVRVERATRLLRGTPDMLIIDAALACGYESVEGFSRAFKRQFGISPGQWNRQQPLQDSKIGQVVEAFPCYTVDALCKFADTDGLEVQIRSLPAQRLAYIRVHDSYRDFERIVQAYEHLMAWYQMCGGSLLDARVYGMSQDDRDVTPLAKCRFDWCVMVPDDWRPTGIISIRDFPTCTVAAIRVQGDIHLLDRAWQYLWRYWLPRSRFQPDNLPAMEIYRRQPLDLSWDTYDMDCAVPVVSLQDYRGGNSGPGDIFDQPDRRRH